MLLLLVALAYPTFELSSEFYVLQAALVDGFMFDLLRFQLDGSTTSEIDIYRRQISSGFRLTCCTRLVHLR